MKSVRKQSPAISRSWQEYVGVLQEISFVRWFVGLAIVSILLIAAASVFTRQRASVDITGIAVLVVQIVGIVVAALMIVFTIVDLQMRTYRTLRRQNYMRLELESIALFHFDIENAELASQIWSDRVLADMSDPLAALRIQQYVSSILNLFEISIRSRKIDEMPHDAFASWVIWMDELCTSRNFKLIWTEHFPNMRWNYLRELRQMLDVGLSIHQGAPNTTEELEIQADIAISERERTIRFFTFAADLFDCDEIRRWFDETETQS